MKSRPLLILFSLLLAIALSWIFYDYSAPGRQALQVFPAIINRDCAPWDGAAFTMKISMPDGRTLDLSIWQSPEISLPTTFTFPDQTGQVGNALLVPPSAMPEQLTGKVSLQGVRQGMPVEGRFSLQSERGEQFQGRFVAEWDDQIALCG
jgi:hypothetical protein